ncbi:hypothetical protein VHEMI01927 [[Torrubiella] hemipterigena]|uniref:Uncharacterized protein n=1 Tax=[Torrubiella] hemipterigena TaxID=1531966 RepID=A0A0A1T696_9HYPO|nr:hypothetical protein VHEMI01927 [[Torrubiella] hemipterigena]
MPSWQDLPTVRSDDDTDQDVNAVDNRAQFPIETFGPDNTGGISNDLTVFSAHVDFDLDATHLEFLGPEFVVVEMPDYPPHQDGRYYCRDAECDPRPSFTTGSALKYYDPYSPM